MSSTTLPATSNSRDSDALAQLLEFLPCATPAAWIQAALQDQETLLIDHCANELKASRNAMNLMARNPDKKDLLSKMSKLAREELVHFDQVLKIIKKRGMNYRAIKPSRYAGMLAQGIRKQEPQRLIDSLIVGGFIEARSCERFSALAPHLDQELQTFYVSLLKSEARHYSDYISLAEKYADESITERVAYFAELEREAIESEDSQFRFHSGVPVIVVAALGV